MKKIADKIAIAAIVLGFIWVVYLLNMILPVEFRNFGIFPRNPHSLVGIICAPFIHVDFWHIVANSTALFVLLSIGFVFEFNMTLVVIIVIILGGGAGSWLFGMPKSVHFGASGLIFGLIGYLIFCGWYHRKLKSIFVSLLVLILYGGLMLVLFKVTEGISWTGHFFGFISGVFAAKCTKNWSK